MKKILSIIIVVILALSLSACGNDNGDNKASDKDSNDKNSKRKNTTVSKAVDNLAASYRDYDAYLACFQKDVYDALNDRGYIPSREEAESFLEDIPEGRKKEDIKQYCYTLKAEILETTYCDDEGLMEIKTGLKKEFGISESAVEEAVKLKIKLSFNEREKVKTDTENEIFVKIDGEWFWIEIFQDAARVLDSEDEKISYYDIEPFG